MIVPDPGGSSTDGFTLVELLVSLAVLAMMSLLLVESLGGRNLAWTRIDRDTAIGETEEAARGVLSDRVERIWPVTDYNPRPPGPQFDGQADQMEFLAPPMEAGGRAALRRYRLILDAAGNLDLDSLSDVGRDQDHWATRQVLMRGVQTLDLAYFAPAPGQGPRWHEDWRRQAVMPTLVRIRLSFANGDRRRWPDLIVHPRADVDTQCDLLISTGGCNGR